MSDTNDKRSLLEPLFHALDPISLILNQNPLSDHPVPLKLTSADSFVTERGPRYKAYAELRETRLLMRQQQQQHEELEPKLATPPPRKQVKFQPGLVANGRKGSSPAILAQSVPDFSATLRKENRKPVNNALPPPITTPPPSSKSFNSTGNGVDSGSRGSMSESAGEKKKKKKKEGGGAVLMARRSYASIVDELRGLPSATASGINGEGRREGDTNNRVLGKSHSGHYRAQF